MPIPEPCLRAMDLEYARDDRSLFSHLNVELNPGEALHIEGENGCGKTTLLRILCGLIQADTGQVYWSGTDIQKDRYQFTSAMAYVGHHDGLKKECSPLENLNFARALYQSKQDSSDQNKYAEAMDSQQALHELGLRGFDHQLCQTLSAGQRRRVALARLLVCPATLWILDEPLTAIDQTGIANLETLLGRHVQSGGLLILTSHHRLNLEGIKNKKLLLGAKP